MDRFNLAQLTKQMVSLRLKELKEPAEVIQAIVLETLTTYLKGLKETHPEVKEGVKEVARGAVIALLAREEMLGRGVVAVLRGVQEAALTQQLDPMTVMTWALEGIADLRRFVPMESLYPIVSEIDREFMGAGEVIRKLLERAPGEPPRIKTD